MSDPMLYTIGWISAISTEQTAARQFLDEQHDRPEYVSPHDNNSYTLGRIGKHNVVIATLPDGEYGECSATAVARDMLSSFPNVRVALMVGIGGGAPSPKHDIRLGDVVVSSPAGGDGGVFQYDFGKTIQDQEFQHTRHLDKPPTILRTTVSSIKSRHEETGTLVDDAINTILSQKPRLKKKYSRPDASTDQLYKSSYTHRSEDGPCEEHCGSDASNIVQRRLRGDEDDNPAIHYGLIASANQLMKDATIRDALIKERDVLCFEMEAAGLMNHFPCLVIRGICDYADSHKNKQWQGYGAMTAAAYAKQVIENVAPTGVENLTRLAEILKSIENEVAHISSVVNVINVDTKSLVTDEKLRRMRIWLSPEDPSSNHNNAVAQCHEGTGQWFLQGETFTDFKCGKIPFLWLNGLPGCGKTILTSSIIEDLEQVSSNSGSRTLYFYFDFSDARKQTFQSVVRSLLWQAAVCPGGSSQTLSQLYDSCKKGERQPSVTSLVEALENELEPQNTTIIIDALDECTTRLDVLSWLPQLTTLNAGSVRVIVTSRREQDIDAEMGKWLDKTAVISLQEQVVDKDIGAYVRHRLRTDAQLQRWRSDPEIQDEIEMNLMNGAHGMFRWAKCQIDALAECLTYPQLTNALASLPPTLNATYARLIDEIPYRYREQSIRLLQVLLWSERPLKFAELIDYLAVDPECEPGFHVKNRMPVPEEITRLCPGLVTITVKTRDVNLPFPILTVTEDFTVIRPEPEKVVHLVHFSVKEYLTSCDLNMDIASSLRQTAAAERIASVSLAYILSPEKPVNFSSSDDRNLVLLHYCGEYWMKSARLAGNGTQTLQQLIMKFLSNEQQFTEWIAAYYFYGWHQDMREIVAKQPVQPLYYASMAGLEFATKSLLAANADVDAQGGIALQAACAKGHKKIAAMLLGAGADVKARGGVAFQAACANGDVEVVSMLLDKGADVNCQGYMLNWRYFGLEGKTATALYSAVINGSAETVELLLKSGADPNVKGVSYSVTERLAHIMLRNGVDVNAEIDTSNSTAIATCTPGLRLLARLLLVDGIDGSTQLTFYDSALQAACAMGRCDLTKMLIREGAAINARGGHYGDALQAACHNGHEAIAQILLDSGADVDAEGGSYGSALQAACAGGHANIARILFDGSTNADIRQKALGLLPDAQKAGAVDVVQLLLENNADANVEVEFPHLLICRAALMGQGDILALLIKHGADVNTRNRQGSSSLHIAAARGLESIVSILLDNDADSTLVDRHGSTPLHAAVCKGHTAVVLLLLSRGTNVDQQMRTEPTLLHAAVALGQETIVLLLLSRGINIDAIDTLKRTALHRAVESGQETISSLLIDMKANCYLPDISGRYALDLAIEKEQMAIVQLLLAKTNISRWLTERGSHRLLWAAERGHEALLRLLLKHTALRDDIDTLRHTALHSAAGAGHVVGVRLMLEQGTHVDIADEYNKTPLHRASEAGHESVVNLLSSHGADLNIEDNSGETALHSAAHRGAETMAQVLLLNGASVNLADKTGMTALHKAAHSGHKTLVQLLLANGADADIEDEYGRTALDWAISHDQEDVILSLLEY